MLTAIVLTSMGKASLLRTRDVGVCSRCLFARNVNQSQQKENTMTNTNQPKRKPAFTLRDGTLKATLWKNDGEKGPWFSVDFSRGYRVDGNWKDTSSIGGDDLLKLAFLAQEAYAKQLELKEAHRNSVNSDAEGGAV